MVSFAFQLLVSGVTLNGFPNLAETFLKHLKHESSLMYLFRSLKVPNVRPTFHFQNFLLRSFSWYTSTERVEMKAKELESALEKDGLSDFVSYDITYAYAGYDDPWTLPFLRHNEVWLLQKEN